MNNELENHGSWWKRNWKWVIPIFGIIAISITVFLSSEMDGVAADLAKAYADPELYNNALDKVRTDHRVNALLGEIQPIDKMAIIEGQVEYSNDDTTVFSSVRIIGTKGKANMDISADRLNNTWNYNQIKIRIKNPPENKQEIEIDTGEKTVGNNARSSASTVFIREVNPTPCLSSSSYSYLKAYNPQVFSLSISPPKI